MSEAFGQDSVHFAFGGYDMSKSFFCTPELCERAFQEQRERIESAIRVEKGKAFALAVLHPTLTYEKAEGLIMEYPSWSAVLLWENTVGQSMELPTYIANARLKALEALYHKESLLQVWLQRPATLRAGHIGWYGGIYRHGIAAGGSGLNEKSDDQQVDLLVLKIHEEVKKMSKWTPSSFRVTQLRRWGGFLGGLSS